MNKNTTTDNLKQVKGSVTEALDKVTGNEKLEEIAKKLGVALSTVRNSVATIYAKLDVHSRGAVVLWARNHGYFVAQAVKAP